MQDDGIDQDSDDLNNRGTLVRSQAQFQTINHSPRDQIVDLRINVQKR